MHTHTQENRAGAKKDEMKMKMVQNNKRLDFNPTSKYECSTYTKILIKETAI